MLATRRPGSSELGEPALSRLCLSLWLSPFNTRMSTLWVVISWSILPDSVLIGRMSLPKVAAARSSRFSRCSIGGVFVEGEWGGS